MQTIEDRLAFPVAAVGHAVGQAEGTRVGAEQPVDLGRIPDVEFALLPLAVGIEAGRERLLDQHLPLEPADRLGNARREQRIASVRRRVGQQRDQLGIVVEHLLEVRHQPQRIDRIARKAAAQVIVDAALADVDERVQHGLAKRRILRRQGLTPEQMQHRRLRELRRAGEAAVNGIERLGEALRSLGDERGRQRFGPRRGGEAGKRVLERGGVAGDPFPVVAPDARDGLEHLRKTGPAIARFRREIGAAPERLARRA